MLPFAVLLPSRRPKTEAVKAGKSNLLMDAIFFIHERTAAGNVGSS